MAELAVVAPLIRICPGRDGVSIWSSALFGEPEGISLRRFLARVFTVPDVAAVSLRSQDHFGRIRYERSDQASRIWQKLSQALRLPDNDDGDALRAGGLFLAQPWGGDIEVRRIGGTLTTWRLQAQTSERLRLSHRLLRRRRGIAYRLEDALSRVSGVEAVTTNTAAGSVSIRFNPLAVAPDQLVGWLEKSWPAVLGGTEAPPSNRRLVFVGGLLSLAAVGEYLVPAMRPVAVLGVTINGLPNVINGTKDLTNWRVGLPALYAVGLGLMLWTGLPFNATIFAVLMQLWPKLSFNLLTKSQRVLFADVRVQVLSAKQLGKDGRVAEVDSDTLKRGDMVVVPRGRLIPADGVVTGGHAVVNEEVLSGNAYFQDKRAGDAVYANTRVINGDLTIRVERLGGETVAGQIAALLPRGPIADLPSASHAENIADRNAKPAIALAGLNLLLRRSIRPSQALIRPDYATAPRLSAQLTALLGLGRALRRGIVFRDPAKLDMVAQADIYVFDDTSGLGQPRLGVAGVITAGEISADSILGYAAAAFPDAASVRGAALRLESIRRSAPVPAIETYVRQAGAIRYLTAEGHEISVTLQAYTADSDIPVQLRQARLRFGGEAVEPVWIRRDGKICGFVALGRAGAPEAVEVLTALKARDKNSRFVYLSAEREAQAEAIAGAAGISTVFADLSTHGKVEVLAKLGRRAVWVGNGATPIVRDFIRASHVSISAAGMATIADDAADILLLQPGLQSLLPLARIGEAHRDHLKTDYQVVYLANLLGAAGGVLSNVGGREAGLISNAGTGVVFGRRWAQLRGLATQLEKRRGDK
jgi:cation transport ATPase